MELVLKEME